jgi:hypothetical protein
LTFFWLLFCGLLAARTTVTLLRIGKLIHKFKLSWEGLERGISYGIWAATRRHQRTTGSAAANLAWITGALGLPPALFAVTRVPASTIETNVQYQMLATCNP